MTFNIVARAQAPIGVTAVGVALLAAAFGIGPSAGSGAALDATAEVSTAVHDAEGNEIGTASVTSVSGGQRVTVTMHTLDRGYHGLHIHTTGLCEPDSASPTDPSSIGNFLSAGGHLAHGEQQHGAHSGDLPSLYVGKDGAGTLTFVTDAFSMAALLDDDGSAVMVHEGRDNYANIPDRYAPTPDVDTLKTGDSGARIACGVLSR